MRAHHNQVNRVMGGIIENLGRCITNINHGLHFDMAMLKTFSQAV